MIKNIIMILKFKEIIFQSIDASRLIALSIMFACAIVFVSYFTGNELVYRPTIDGPAIHPMTTLLLLTLSLNCQKLQMSYRSSIALLTFSGLCLVLYFQHWMTAINLVDDILSANQTFNHLLYDSSPMKMGSNTAYMLTSILFAQALILTNRFLVVAQIFALGSAFLPFVSIIGYLYSIDSFHGQMSPTTTVLGGALSVATILLQAKRGIIYALLAPTFGARLVRWQLMVGITLFVSSGYVVVGINDDGKFISLYVASICFFFLLIMAVSAVSYERYDRHRRSLEDKLSFISVTDKLTSVYNRFAMEKDLKKSFDNFLNEGEEVSVLLVDVDHFKSVNDVYGHLTGDKVLQTVAKILKSRIRSMDSVYRYGGEEFLVMLNQCEVGKAVQIAEELRKSIEGTDLSPIIGCSKRTNVTVSIGCASLCQATSPDSVLNLADKAMYTAKRSGRNQVCMAPTKTLHNCNH